MRHNGRVPERTRPAIRVLVVDDHPVVRRGLRALLDTLDGIDVVGEASDGETAVNLAQQIRPDVVLMDLHMPGMGGIEATRLIAQQGRAPAVLVMTMLDGDEMVVSAVQAGARGYLVKGAQQDEISRALRAVASGEVIFGPDIAAQVLDVLGGAASAQADQDAFVDLTGRERDILDLLASGRRTASIAAQLYLAPKTVSNALTSIFAKLQVDGRAEAIVVARKHGFGQEAP